jgi:phage repressor protein C with HTH and peptisase S24 domain
MGDMGNMGLKRRPLDAEQLADARRLESVWLAFKRKRPEATQHWVARQMGWKTQAAAHQYIAGKIPLNLDALLKFSGLFGVEPDRISPTLALKLPVAVKDAQPSYVYFTKCDVRFAGGSGSFAFVNQEREKSHAFRREWMTKRRFKEEAMRIIDVVGDSMYPLIRDGDVVCVNTADREPKSGEIYAIATADGPRVKYLYRRESDGKWELRSENPSPRYAPEELTEAHQLSIVGRVVWRAGDV